MNFTEAIRNCKQDIAGKFKDISTAISSLDVDSFNDPENHEIFHAVHEVTLKTVKISRNTIAKKLNLDITLVMTDNESNLDSLSFRLKGLR